MLAYHSESTLIPETAMFQRLHHIAYRCHDAQRTVDFYTKVIGLKYAAGLLPPESRSAPSWPLNEPGQPPRVLGISTTAMDADNPRFSTSDCLLEHAVAHLAGQGAETQVIRLRDLSFRPCEGNYSKASHACTWPCAM